MSCFQGETMAKKRYYDGMYAGMDSRRIQEKMDGAMVKEDLSAIANLPQNVIYKEYKSVDYAPMPYLDDTIGGINRQMKEDLKERKKESYPDKF